METLKILDALIAVIEGKADGVWNTLAVLNETTRKHLLPGLKLGFVHYSEHTGDFRIAMRNDWPLMQSIVNKAIDTISIEEHMAIQRKWLGKGLPDTPNYFRFMGKLSDSEHQWIDQHEAVHIDIGTNLHPIISREINRRLMVENELNLTLGNLRQTQSQLIQSAKMASIGEMATGVAHELNQPLSNWFAHS